MSGQIVNEIGESHLCALLWVVAALPVTTIFEDLLVVDVQVYQLMPLPGDTNRTSERRNAGAIFRKRCILECVISGGAPKTMK